MVIGFASVEWGTPGVSPVLFCAYTVAEMAAEIESAAGKEGLKITAIIRITKPFKFSKCCVHRFHEKEHEAKRDTWKSYIQLAHHAAQATLGGQNPDCTSTQFCLF